MRSDSDIFDYFHGAAVKFYEPVIDADGYADTHYGDAVTYDNGKMILLIDKVVFPTTDAAVLFKLELSDQLEFDSRETSNMSDTAWDFTIYVRSVAHRNKT